MRGQGVADAAQITSDSSVGIYSDGFYIARPQAAVFELTDLERVEVLRGPQGTLYGRNTTGGAVNLISAKPTGEFGFKEDFTVGSRAQIRSQTSINLPKWNDISTKLTVLKSRKDGFVKNSGGHDYGESDQFAGRFALKWDIADNITADYFAEMGELDTTPSYYQNEDVQDGKDHPASRTYIGLDLPSSNGNFEGHGLTLTWDVDSTLTIKSLTGYRELDTDEYQNYANSFTINFGPTSAPVPFPLGTTSYDRVREHQFSQEFQFIGSLMNERIRYVTGLYYFKEGASHFQNYQIDGLAIPFGGDFFQNKDRYATVDSESKAIYAQVTWTPQILNDKLDLTLGLRQTWDDRDATRSLAYTGFGTYFDTLFGGPPGTIYPLGTENNAKAGDSWSKFNPSFTANYTISDDMSMYGKVSTGYKAGGFSESSPVNNFQQGFDPEEVTAYELGFKSYWLDRKVRLNVSAFQNDFDDMQLFFNFNPDDSSVVQALNAGQATVRGIELDLMVMPIDDLTLTMEYAYLDPEFDEVEALAGTVFDPAVNSESPYQVGDNIKDVFAVPYASKNSVTLNADYTFWHFAGGNMSGNLNYRWKSEYFNTATTGKAVPGRDNYEVPSYGLLDARLTLALDKTQNGQFKFSVWGKNILDKEYPQQVIGMGGPIDVNTINGPVAGGYYGQTRIWSEPPSYGIDIHYEY
jgi:iron complex outermembrane recepter protein